MREPPQSARIAALGQAVAVIPLGLGSLYENPAGLAFDTSMSGISVGIGQVFSSVSGVSEGADFSRASVALTLPRRVRGVLCVGVAFRGGPTDDQIEELTERDLAEIAVTVDHDRDGRIDPVLDDVGDHIDTVIAIRQAYEPIVHYTTRATVAYALHLHNRAAMPQSIGLVLDYREFPLGPDLASLDLGYLLQFGGTGWRLACTTRNLVQYVGPSPILPYQEYLWKELLIAGGLQRTLVGSRDQPGVGLGIGTSVVFRYCRQTAHRNAVLDGGSLYGYRGYGAGLSVEVALRDMVFPRLAVDAGQDRAWFRLTGGLGIRLMRYLHIDVGVYEERGGPYEGMVWIASLQAGGTRAGRGSAVEGGQFP